MNIEAVFSSDNSAFAIGQLGIRELLRHYRAVYTLRAQVAAERKQLAELPDELLKDIGIRHEDAMLESQREPNDLPIERLEQLKRCRY